MEADLCFLLWVLDSGIKFMYVIINDQMIKWCVQYWWIYINGYLTDRIWTLNLSHSPNTYNFPLYTLESVNSTSPDSPCFPVTSRQPMLCLPPHTSTFGAPHYLSRHMLSRCRPSFYVLCVSMCHSLLVSTYPSYVVPENTPSLHMLALPLHILPT